MAYLVVRRDGRCEVRESMVAGGRTRSRHLASFRRALTPDVLERVESKASRPIDRDRLRARACRLGILVTDRRDDRAARALLAHLRNGASIDPVLVTILRAELARAPAAPIPEALADVADWIGVDAVRRAEALRGLLRVSDRIMRGRASAPEKPPLDYPRFSSRGPSRRRTPKR